MQTRGQIEPQLLLIAAFSRHESALDWAAERLGQRFGPLLRASARYPFTQTAYYEKAMGPNLRKQLFAFERFVPMDSLAQIKRATIGLEKELAGSGRFPEPRPLNLDPGFIGLGKFVLATTKDQAHRIYLCDGIFAEVTLQFQDGHFRANPWTYPDYLQPGVSAFLEELREEFRRRRGRGE
jgi:hypothetical protein